MSVQTTRKDYVSKTWRLPYQFFYKVLTEVYTQGWASKKETDLGPNRFVLYLSSQDRSPRKQNENFFLEELTHDLIAYSRENAELGQARMQLAIRSDDTLTPGRVRIECFSGDTFLFGALREWKGHLGALASGTTEWDGTELLTQSLSAAPMVLVVDDEPVLCAVLQRMLGKLKYQVVTANNGLEALRILAHLRIDLVITDLRMPKMDGWELMQRVKAATPEMPVVLITGYHSMYSRDMADASAAAGYISKPFSFLEIKNLLGSVLGAQDIGAQL